MNHTITPLDEATRQRIIARMMREHDFSSEMATAIMDETLVYMHAANHDTEGIGPSKIVDVGWHTFILYTWEYAQYCQDAFGHFLHHSPTDYEGASDMPLSATLAFMEANGITYDPDLWGPVMGNGKCSNPGPGCKNTCAQCGRRKAEAVSQCVGQGGPNCGTQVDPRTPCDPILAFANATNMADCNGSGGWGCQGGPGCGTQLR